MRFEKPSLCNLDTSLNEDKLPDEDMLVSVCAGLVVIDQHSDIIRLVHFTTQKYFDHVRASRFPSVPAEIVEICITYLSFDIFVPLPSRECQMFGNRPWHANINFFHYATRNWAAHTRGESEEILKGL